MREVLARRFKRLLAEAPRAGNDGGAAFPSPLVGEGGARSAPGEGSMVGFSEETRHPAAFGVDPLPQGERVIEQAEGELDQADTDSPWPDLVLIDGGQGQLTAARETFAELGVTGVPLVAVAKGPERDAGRETVF